jgi:hypothetical protein
LNTLIPLSLIRVMGCGDHDARIEHMSLILPSRLRMLGYPIRAGRRTHSRGALD